MTKMPFSRLLLSAAMLSTIALTGCDIDDASTPPTSDIAYGPNVGGPDCNIVDLIADECAVITDPAPGFYMPGTHPRFTPAANDLPLNTDILFAGTTDGTAVRTNPANPVEIALGKLDGWSVTAGFNILMSGSIDGDTVSADGGMSQLTNPAQTVFVLPIETVEGGDALDPGDIDASAPFDTGLIAATRFNADAVDIDGGSSNALRITPTSPLLPKKKYLVIVTNGIKDTADDPITASASYELLGVPGGSEACAAEGVNPALHGVCDAIDGWEQLAVGFLQNRNTQINTIAGLPLLPTDPAVIRGSLALTYTFTTTDPTAVMLAMAAPRAAVAKAALDAGADAPSAVMLANGLQAAGLLSTPEAADIEMAPAQAVIDLGAFDGNATDDPEAPNPLPSGVGLLYTGAITLPYYQATPLDTGFFTTGWTADQALGAALSEQLGQTVPPADNDGSYNVTYRYPFAGKRNEAGAVKVPLQVTLPDPAFVPTNPAFGGNACGLIQFAQGGYPVVIYVHGITSDRASVAALAHSLAANCVATVAIDLPMHGIAGSSPFNSFLNTGSAGFQTLYPGVSERHFNLKAGATGAPVAMAGDSSDDSGSLFINLGYAVNSRDNIRQAVMDLLNLNASLADIGALDLDDDGIDDFNLDKVHVVGVSLGGMVGSIFAATNQQAIAAEQMLGFSSNLNPIQGAVLSVAGGQLTKVLENSLAFSARILPGLAANGLTVGTENFERFMYVFQSMVDPADPINFAQPLGATGMPLLLQEIVGGGDVSDFGDDKVYTADKVVPNNVLEPLNDGGFPAPLAGTDPWAELIGAEITGPGTQDASSTPLLVRLTIGHHGSLLRPQESSGSATTGENIATSELQTQAVSFVLSSGSNVLVGSGGTGLAALYIDAPPP